MALARLALKNLQHRSSPAAFAGISALQNHPLRSFSEKPESDPQVALAKKSKLSPRRRRSRANNRDFVPALWELFPSGLGNALLQATENINRVMEKLSPPRLMGRAREDEDSYKLRYHMPGLAKEDVKITVEDGVLSIRGEHKQEEEGGSDDDSWSESRYGYYNTTMMLPEDAKVEEIKAEMKDGVLNIVIPKSERVNKDVKEVQVL